MTKLYFSKSLLSSPPDSHSSLHSSNGSDALSNLDASQVVSDSISDSRLSTNVLFLNNLWSNKYQNSLSIDICERPFALAGPTLTNSNVSTSFFTPLISLTVSQMTVQTLDVAANGLTFARMGLYTFIGSTMTLVARTAMDTSLFTSTNTFYTRSFDTTGGYPSTFDLQAGTRYGVSILCTGTTMPRFYGATFPFEIGGLSPQLSSSRGSQSDLFTSWSAVGAAFSAQIWCRLS